MGSVFSHTPGATDYSAVQEAMKSISISLTPCEFLGYFYVKMHQISLAHIAWAQNADDEVFMEAIKSVYF